MVSCAQHTHKKVYKTADGKGYCYQDDDLLWYMLYYNQTTGQYTYSNTPLSEAPSYDASSTYTVELSSENTAGYSDMAEADGTSEGGSDSDASSDADSGGMSESDGSSEGGSDSSSDSGSDGGGSDGGGGDGGGGGE